MGYEQLFRNGALEAVDWLGLSQGRRHIPSVECEGKAIAALRHYLDLLRDLEVQLPLLAALTLVNVKGCKLLRRSHEATMRAVDRDHLFLPEMLIENYESEPELLLRHTFDAIWQVAGEGSCQNYDENGRWDS